MDDTLCPRCRNPLFHDAEETPCGNVAIRPGCSACSWEPIALYSEYPMCGAESAKAEALATLDADVSPLAWFEPRDRLPTPEEEDAHTAKHGAGAGWMVQMLNGARWNGWRQTSSEGLANTRKHWPSFRFQAYPVTADGRPVGWPEVKQ